MKKISSIGRILHDFGYPEKSVIVKSRYGIGGRGVYLLLGNQKADLKKNDEIAVFPPVSGG